MFFHGDLPLAFLTIFVIRCEILSLLLRLFFSFTMPNAFLSRYFKHLLQKQTQDIFELLYKIAKVMPEKKRGNVLYPD